MIQGTTQSKPKTVLIIGAGFLGGHIAVPLLKSGLAVSMLDWDEQEIELAKTICKNSDAPKGNLRTIYGGRFRFEGKNITVQGEMPEVIINCLSTQLYRKDTCDLVDVLEKDALIHARFLELAAEEKTRQIILFSSDAVYGDKIPGNPADEHDSTLRPSSNVGHVMHMMEKTLLEWSDVTKKTATIFRPSNIYGHLNNCGVVKTFFEQAIMRLPSIIYGDGTNVRDYVYIDDVTRMTQMAIEHQIHGIYNASSGRETNTRQLESAIVETTGMVNQREFVKHPKGVKPISYVCLKETRARQKMQVPVTPLEEGLVMTYQKMKS